MIIWLSGTHPKKRSIAWSLKRSMQNGRHIHILDETIPRAWRNGLVKDDDRLELMMLYAEEFVIGGAIVIVCSEKHPKGPYHIGPFYKISIDAEDEMDEEPIILDSVVQEILNEVHG